MKDFKSCAKAYYAMARPFGWRVLVSVVIGLVRIAASLGFVWISKRLVDIATGESPMSLKWGVVIIVSIVLVQILGNLAASYWNGLITVKTQNTLRYRYFKKILRSAWNGRETFRSGDAVSRIFEDVRLMTDQICNVVPGVIVTLCQLVAASIYLTSMEPALLWLLVLLMVVGVLGSKMFYKKFRQLTNTIRQAEASAQQQMQESLLNRALVLTLFGSEKILKKLGYTLDLAKDTTVTRLNYRTFTRAFMGLGFMGGYAAAFLWGIFGIKSGAVTFGMMTAFLQLVGQVQRPIAELSNQIPSFIRSLTSVERLMEIDELQDIDDGDRQACSEAPAISLESVCFAYPDSTENIFDDFSYTFPAGSLTSIMGPTGAGKSTLVRLVMGLLVPQKGSVTLFTKDSYMYVPQGNSLMSGTIRENLLLANSEATEEDMRAALHTAAADFVYELPLGLDAICGETGSGLSEGQAQRIAIARALLHRGRILILDEATSALDVETEKRLLSNISDKYKGDKTILFITHREAVKEYSDAILKVD